MKRKVIIAIAAVLILAGVGAYFGVSGLQDSAADGVRSLTQQDDAGKRADVEAMRDAVGAAMEYCMTNGMLSWTPSVQDDYAVHDTLNMYANTHFHDEIQKRLLRDQPYNGGAFSVKGAELRSAAKAIFPDFRGVIPGEDITDPYYQWYSIVPIENDCFAVTLGDTGEWVGDLESVTWDDEGCATAEFAIIDYSDLSRIGSVVARMKPVSSGVKQGGFAYRIQNVQLVMTPQQTGTIGWFDAVSGARFYLPEGFKRIENPNAARAMGMYSYEFYNASLDMRIQITEFTNTTSFTRTGAGFIQENYEQTKQNHGNTVTYDSRYERGYAVSGYEGDRIYYDRCSSKGTVGFLFTIDYPASNASVCNNIVGKFFDDYTPPWS